MPKVARAVRLTKEIYREALSWPESEETKRLRLLLVEVERLLHEIGGWRCPEFPQKKSEPPYKILDAEGHDITEEVDLDELDEARAEICFLGWDKEERPVFGIR